MAQQCYGLATWCVVRHDNKDRVFCIPRSFKRQSLSNFIDRRLIFACYNILRSLIHEPKQARYVCNWFTFSLAYITHWVPRTAYPTIKTTLYLAISSLTAYRVPRSQLLRQLFLLYMSLTAYRVAGYAEVSSSAGQGILQLLHPFCGNSVTVVQKTWHDVCFNSHNVA